MVLYTDGVDVLAAGRDDEVLNAVGEVEIASFERADVAGVQPAVAQRPAGFFRMVEVAHDTDRAATPGCTTVKSLTSSRQGHADRARIGAPIGLVARCAHSVCPTPRTNFRPRAMYTAQQIGEGRRGDGVSRRERCTPIASAGCCRNEDAGEPEYDHQMQRDQAWLLAIGRRLEPIPIAVVARC